MRATHHVWLKLCITELLFFTFFYWKNDVYHATVTVSYKTRKRPSKHRQHDPPILCQDKERAVRLTNSRKFIAKLSKRMSYFLRHGATKLGVPIRSDGYMKILDLLDILRKESNTRVDFSQLILEHIHYVVKHDENGPSR